VKWSVRRARIKDCAKVQRIITKVWNDTYRGIVSDDFLDKLNLNEQKRTKKNIENFGKEDFSRFVLVINKNLVGFVTVGKSKDKDYQDSGEVFSLYMLKEYKGHGLGKKLFLRGLLELKKLGFKNCVIGCLEGNISNGFYQHLGGVLVKTRVFFNAGKNLLENVYYYDNITKVLEENEYLK